MDLVTLNVLRHIFETLQTCKRLADGSTISNLKQFCNKLVAKCCESEKKLSLITEKNVDDFYAQRMTREVFAEIIYTKLIAKSTNFDMNKLYKVCWNCFYGSEDDHNKVTVISEQSAKLLWLLFCKLDTEGKLKLHLQDVTELILRLHKHLKVSVDQKTMDSWASKETGSSDDWIDFWSFCTLTDKCLASRETKSANEAVKLLFEEIYREVIACGSMYKRGTNTQKYIWKAKWFILTASKLLHCDSKDASVGKAAVVFSSHIRVEVMQDKNEKDSRYPNRFKVINTGSGQSTEMSAMSVEQMNEWVKAINAAIKLSTIKGANYLHRLQKLHSTEMSQPTVLSPVIKLSQSMDNLEPSNTAAIDINRLQEMNSLPAMPRNPSSTLSQCKQEIDTMIQERYDSDLSGQATAAVQSPPEIIDKISNKSDESTTHVQSYHDLEDQMKQLQIDHNSHGDQLIAFNITVDKHKTDIQKSNERIEVLEKALVEIQNQLSRTQQQLSDVHKNNEMLQISNLDLKNQLSLTQQQLLGVHSMITSSRLWVVSHDQFIIGREIGRGAWATVHEATFRGATVAAKRLHQIITAPKTRQLFQREMEMALRCQHQNIVTFLGATLTLEGSPVILMELMDTNLRSAYEQGHIKDHQILGILHDIASALHFLHTRPDPVIHRDVSSANVLLKAQYNGEWLAKLGDLGTANIQQQAATAGPGAIAYGAPEACDSTKHSPKMDVYSYGVLVLEILTKTHPFQVVDDLKVKVQQQFPQYNQLVTSCTNKQSNDRPSMYDVIGQLNKISTV